MLCFNTYNLVGAIANGSSIDSFALAQTGNEEVMSHLFGRRSGSTRMNREPLLGTARHHQRYRCSQYQFFHFTVPDNIIMFRSNRVQRGKVFTINTMQIHPLVSRMLTRLISSDNIAIVSRCYETLLMAELIQ